LLINDEKGPQLKDQIKDKEEAKQPQEIKD
jgi:hypothetical protein